MTPDTQAAHEAAVRFVRTTADDWQERKKAKQLTLDQLRYVAAMADAALVAEKVLLESPIDNRCDWCGWPLVKHPEPGCWGSNCSMRPLPELTETGKLRQAIRAALSAIERARKGE